MDANIATNNNIQAQIDDINRKLDILLEETHAQRQSREQVNDLVADLSIVGKDAFKATVQTLDTAGVELDVEALTALLMKAIRNIHILNDMFDMMESGYDLIQDSGPIVKQMGLDAIQQMNTLDQRGYFEFTREAGRVFDEVVTNFSKEDLRALSDNVVSILNTVKSMTQPEMLKSINNAVSIYQHMEMENIPEVSFWKAFRELRTPEMRKGLGFIITFLKNLNKLDK